MNRKGFFILTICALALVTSLGFMYFRTGRPSLGVTMSARGSRTNVSGKVVLEFAISNAGPRMVQILPGIKRPPNTIDLTLSMVATELRHGEETIFEFPSTGGEPIVHCQQEGFSGTGWRSDLKRFWAERILRKPFVEIVTPQTQQ